MLLENKHSISYEIVHVMLQCTKWVMMKLPWSLFLNNGKGIPKHKNEVIKFVLNNNMHLHFVSKDSENVTVVT